MTPILRAIAAPRRVEILRLLCQREQTVGDIQRAFGDVTLGAVSQHLRLLKRAGLVGSRREGRNRVYFVEKETLRPFRAWLEAMWDSALYRLKLEAEIEQSRRGPKRIRKVKRGRR